MFTGDERIEKATRVRVRAQLPRRLAGDGSPGTLAAALAPALMRLTMGFNHDRSLLPASYLQDPKLLAAYMARFTPLGADRVRFALGQGGAAFARLRGLAGERPLRLLDVGAGPGSATLGALSALDLSGDAPPPVCVLIDRTRSALEEAARLADAAGFRARLVRIAHDVTRGLPEGPAFAQPFDLILVANMLNELSESRRGRFVQRLAALLAPEGLLLAVEPGTQAAARDLIALRDRLGELATVAPCPHDLPCPLHAQNRRDWCHVAAPYNRSAWIDALDRVCGLDHTRLVFSYWLARQAADGVLPAGPSRIVSDLLKDEGGSVRLLCTPSGLRRVSAAAFGVAYRGQPWTEKIPSQPANASSRPRKERPRRN
ncbi:MAG: methyltransferase domain-containing protein [Myxococcales bacterium]|nr:MAG: methyltransferase domain-containing protein [Myxococcales bacterium]